MKALFDNNYFTYLYQLLNSRTGLTTWHPVKNVISSKGTGRSTVTRIHGNLQVSSKGKFCLLNF